MGRSPIKEVPTIVRIVTLSAEFRCWDARPEEREMWEWSRRRRRRRRRREEVAGEAVG